jgi:hypothetical protein
MKVCPRAVRSYSDLYLIATGTMGIVSIASRTMLQSNHVSNSSYPTKTASAKAPTPTPDSAPQSNAAATFDITKVRCYNCEGKGHFAKDCPKPKKPRKAKASAAQGESNVELQLEHTMTNSLAQMEARSNSLLVRGSKRTTASRNQVRRCLVLDQDPPNANTALKKFATGPCPPVSGISNSGPSLAARLNLAVLSETPEPSPLPAISKASVASASNEDIAMKDADTDQKEAKRKLQACLNLLQREFTKLNKQVSIATVMNMTFTRTDWQRSQLSIKPTHSQIGCVNQELSQLRGFAEIYIRRNNKVLSAQIGAWADNNRRPESIPD